MTYILTGDICIFVIMLIGIVIQELIHDFIDDLHDNKDD